MKIYTKGGDKGETSLLGGQRVKKSNLRIEAYGTIDELNANLALLRDQAISDKMKENILEIQNTLFVIGAILACEVDPDRFNLPTVKEEEIAHMEEMIDIMEDDLPVLKHFILPGGHPAVSQCHIARCVSRRAERQVVLLSEEVVVEAIIIRYLNRLSDYLFMLSRKIAKDLDIKEVYWRV